MSESPCPVLRNLSFLASISLTSGTRMVSEIQFRRFIVAIVAFVASVARRQLLRWRRRRRWRRWLQRFLVTGTPRRVGHTVARIGFNVDGRAGALVVHVEDQGAGDHLVLQVGQRRRRRRVFGGHRLRLDPRPLRRLLVTLNSQQYKVNGFIFNLIRFFCDTTWSKFNFIIRDDQVSSS